MENFNKYLNMNDNDIDNLLLGLEINTNKKEEKDTKLCNECDSEELVFDSIQGHNVCQDCGTVNMMILDDKPNFNGKNATASYGCPSNYFCPVSALGTKIKSRGYSRISAIQRQGQVPYKEKEVLTTIKSIESKCQKYQIKQPIIDTAKTLYKKIRDYKHIKGKRKGKNMIMRCINRRSMIAACVFIACKLQNEPRSPKEIADLYDLEIKHVNRGYRKFLNLISIDNFYNDFKSSKSTDFIERYSLKLGLEEDHINIAKDISKNIHKLDIVSTHEPSSVAAGCLLLVSKMHGLTSVNKKKISEVFQISDVTISKTYRRIFHYHQIITNNKLTDLIHEKQKTAPKKKINVNEENLVLTEEEIEIEQAKAVIEKQKNKKKRGRKKKSEQLELEI
tara:strand:+ start:4119 stop:5294 length:1176 start_codon:yes stop_codon:yes gene_type:complete